ncbi:MAG: Maf family protein [Vulcanimicrobiaceae bacterium]
MVLDEIVLASASPRRLQLLQSIGLRVRVIPSAYGEPARDDLAPRNLASLHAREKARDVVPRIGEGALVAADTVVEIDGRALGKPRDPAEARTMLELLSGRSHVVHTAFAFRFGEAACDEIESTRVQFYSLSAAEIRRYVASGDSLDKAGAYGIQGRGAALVERIEGDFYTVMGFPLGRFVRTLGRMGFVLTNENLNADTLQ